MFIRAKEVKDATYYQVVEGYRDGGRVRHRTLASLGQHPTPEDAMAAAKRELRKVERAAQRERDYWPPSSERPAYSRKRLADMERRQIALVAKIAALEVVARELAQQPPAGAPVRDAAFAAAVNAIAALMGADPYTVMRQGLVPKAIRPRA